MDFCFIFSSVAGIIQTKNRFVKIKNIRIKKIIIS